MPADGTESLGQEIERYRGSIVSAVARRTGNSDLAEDIAQETMARVLARVRGRGLDDPSKLENFMYRVAANVLREHRRSASRESVDDDHLNGAESAVEDQFQSLARSQETRHLWRALERVASEEYREILVRFYLRQEDKQDICTTLSLNSRQFDNRLHRARIALREEIGSGARGPGLRRLK